MIIHGHPGYKPKRKSRKASVNVAKAYRPDAFRDYRPPAENPVVAARARLLREAPSLGPVGTAAELQKHVVRLEGDMAEREVAAQAEVVRRKKCVAPLYNKGAYQYVGTVEQAKWIGRK